MVPGECVLRFKDVIKKTGVCRSTLYEMIDRKDFPSPIKIGYKSVGFLNSEIEEWIAGRVRATRGDEVAA